LGKLSIDLYRSKFGLDCVALVLRDSFQICGNKLSLKLASTAA